MQGKSTLPPGPRGLPLLGNILQFRHDQLSFLLKLEQTYGRMATIHIGKTPIVLCFRPEHIRYILAENPRNFTNREVSGGLVFGNLLILSLLNRMFSDAAIEGLHKLVGDGLLTTDGDFHRRHRRLLQPAFGKRRVENYRDQIVQYTCETIEQWQPGAVIDIAHDMQALTLRLTMKMLTNIDTTKQNTELGRVIDQVLAQPVSSIEGLLNLQINLPFTPYGRRMAALRKVDTLIYNLIDQRHAEKQDVSDILSIMIQTMDKEGEEAMTRQQVRDELASLIAAGHETTTNTLVWTFYLLSEHPTVLKKVLNELQTVLSGRTPQIDDLPQLTYFDWVIKESMRLYPSAWTQGRQAVEAFDLDGYHFPAGTLLMFSQWVLHRLPDVWGDPEVFRPERWDPVNGGKVPQGAYFPFGIGTRICIGMPLAQIQVRLVLVTILQHYIPHLLPGHPVVPLPLITLRAKRGLRVRLEPTPTVLPVSAEVGVSSSPTVALPQGGECPFPGS